jgi:hypothetical protein
VAYTTDVVSSNLDQGEVYHFVLIKANHGQNEQFLFVIIIFFDGIDVCLMVFIATFNNISVI